MIYKPQQNGKFESKERTWFFQICLGRLRSTRSPAKYSPALLEAARRSKSTMATRTFSCAIDIFWCWGHTQKSVEPRRNLSTTQKLQVDAIYDESTHFDYPSKARWKWKSCVDGKLKLSAQMSILYFIRRCILISEMISTPWNGRATRRHYIIELVFALDRGAIRSERWSKVYFSLGMRHELVLTWSSFKKLWQYMGWPCIMYYLRISRNSLKTCWNHRIILDMRRSRMESIRGNSS